MTMSKIKTYSELVSFPTFEERFNYLKMSGKIGIETFGADRYLNQLFYTSSEWRKFRDKIIIRDNACDLGLSDFPILRKGQLTIHHINPITKEQILERDPCLMDPENVITCKRNPTHEAIHYGDSSKISPITFIERQEGDTKLW